MTNNLRRSGLFAPIDQQAYIEKIVNIDSMPRFQDWKTINAQALVTGRIARQTDGRMKTQFRLWDVFSGQQLFGQQYDTVPDNWRRIAHIISDAIYERLTGEKGYFDSRVVFVDESGPKDRRVKRLAIMDQDGASVRYLTRGDDLVGMTGAFCAIAETGTLMMLSGAETQGATSLLPETHIALVPASRLVPGMEEGFALARAELGQLPRAVNFISGPSRTGDIEQTIVLGAHGPYRVHVILVRGI